MNTKNIARPGDTEGELPDYIFYQFDSLPPGQGFIIYEDNDPQPLYSLLLKEKGDALSWEYLTVGPKKWCVRISRKAEDISTETLGELALSDHRKAVVLRKYGLDYSFKGRRTVKDACAEKGISTKNVERDIKASASQPLVYTVKYLNWDLDYLSDFIVTNHHHFSRKTLLEITGTLEGNAIVINQQYPDLLPLVTMFNQLNKTLVAIMQKEEQLLFPYIKFLVQVTKGKTTANAVPPASIQDHIGHIELLQQDIGEQLGNISRFTKNYTSPEMEGSMLCELMPMLNQLATDLYEHVHIENNILFRKALLLEQEYLAKLQNNNPVPVKANNARSRKSGLL